MSTAQTGIAAPHKSSDFYRPPRITSDCPGKQLLRRSSLQHWKASRLTQGSQGREKVAEESTPKSAVATSPSTLAKDCVTPTQQIPPAGHNRQSSGIKSSSTSSGQSSELIRKITHGNARKKAGDHVVAIGTTTEASSTVQRQALPATNDTFRSSSSLMRPSASSYAYRRKSRSTTNSPPTPHADAPCQASAGSSSHASQGAPPQEASALTGSSSSSRAIRGEDTSGDSDARGLQGKSESSRVTAMAATQVATPPTEIPESRLREPETQARRLPAPPKMRMASSLGEKGVRVTRGGKLQPPGAACSTMQKSSAPSVQRSTPSSKSSPAGTGSGLKRPATKGTSADQKPSAISIPATALRRRGKVEAEGGCLPAPHSTVTIPGGDATPLRSDTDDSRIVSAVRGTDRCNTLRESCATANGVSPARFSSLYRLPSPARALEPAEADAPGSSAGGESGSGLLRMRNSATGSSSFHKSYGGTSRAGGRSSSGIATTRADALESPSAAEGSRSGDTTAEANPRTAAEETSGSVGTKISNVASPFVRKNPDPSASGSPNVCTPPRVTTSGACLPPGSARKVTDPAETLAASTPQGSEGRPLSRITRKSSPSVEDFRKRRSLGFSGLREPASSSREPPECVEQRATQQHQNETSRSRVGSPFPVAAVIEGPSTRKQSAPITTASRSSSRALQARVETDDARIPDEPRKEVHQEQYADGAKVVGVRSPAEASVSKHRDGVEVAQDSSPGEATGSRQEDRLEEAADGRQSSGPVGGQRGDKDRVCDGLTSSEPSDTLQQDDASTEACDGDYVPPEQVDRIEGNEKAAPGSQLAPDSNGEQGGSNAAANSRPAPGSASTPQRDCKDSRQGSFFSGAASLRQGQQLEGEEDADNHCNMAENGYPSAEPSSELQEGGNVASETSLPAQQAIEQQEHEMVASVDRTCPGLAGERHDEGKEASAVRDGSSTEATSGQEASSVLEASGPSSGTPRGESLGGLMPPTPTERCLAEPVDKRTDMSEVNKTLGVPSPGEPESGQGDSAKAGSKERKTVLQGDKVVKSLPNRFVQLREIRKLKAQSATDGIKRIGSLGLSLLAGSSGARPKEDTADASGDEGTSEGSAFSDDESETSDSGTTRSDSNSNSDRNESSEDEDEKGDTSNWVSSTRSWGVGRSSTGREDADIDSESSSSEGSEVSSGSRRSFEGGSSKRPARRERKGYVRGHATFSVSPNRRRAALKTSSSSHACVQAGGGELLSQEELAQESALRELRERLEMGRQELLMERFYRELVMQEQAELRKNVTTKLEAEVAAFKKQLRDQELLHEKEKISLRWQQDDQIQELEKSLRSEGSQSEAALEEAREKAEDARLEAEALKHSNLQQKAELDDLRRKYREQGVALREERQALAKCEAQTRIVAKHCQAARNALKAFVDEVDDGDGDDDGDEEEDEDEDGHEDDGGMFSGNGLDKSGEGQGYREDTRNRE